MSRLVQAVIVAAVVLVALVIVVFVASFFLYNPTDSQGLPIHSAANDAATARYLGWSVPLALVVAIVAGAFFYSRSSRRQS